MLRPAFGPFHLHFHTRIHACARAHILQHFQSVIQFARRTHDRSSHQTLAYFPQFLTLETLSSSVNGTYPLQSPISHHRQLSLPSPPHIPTPHRPPDLADPISAIFFYSMPFLPIFRAELRPTLRLALPLILAEIGWMSMVIVDTMMVGRLPYSAEAIGAVSISSSIFIIFAFFGEGLLIGLDTLVSQSFGAGRREDCHSSLINSIYLSFAIAPFLAIPIWIIPRYFERFGVTQPVAVLAAPSMRTLSAGLVPLLLYFAVRRTLQGMNMVRPIAFALVTANVINFLGNYALIFGKF